MRIELTRLTPTHHRFTYARPDGTGESIELETRSFLAHDLTHFVVERTLGIELGFFGLLARGHGFAELNDRTQPFGALSPDLARAESLVGPLQSHLTGKQVVLPEWDFVPAVERAWRDVWGRWKATRFHEPLVLPWP